MVRIATSSIVLWIASASAIAIFATSPIAAAQERGGAPPPIEKDPEIRTATPDELRALVDEYNTALRAGDGERLTAVLRKMHVHDNGELLECARSGLAYEAGKPDHEAVKKEAAELGMREPAEIQKLLRDREAEVRAAAARLCANLPGKKTTSLLQKALVAKDERTEHPKAFAAVIDALGRLKCLEAHEEIASEFGQFRDREIMRACTRYFGQVQSKDKGVVRQLCEMLDPPQPAGDDANNPPASYWESRWEQWNWIRRDIAWTLKEITGQAFQPADGDHPGDSKKALAWVRDNAKKLGIK